MHSLERGGRMKELVRRIAYLGPPLALIRAAARSEPVVPAINAALAQLNYTAAIETKPMFKTLTFALLPSRFGAAVLGSMGILGPGLAAIGVLLYSVSRRTR